MTDREAFERASIVGRFEPSLDAWDAWQAALASERAKQAEPARHEHERGAPLTADCDNWCKAKYEKHMQHELERECCGTLHGSAHRKTCDKYAASERAKQAEPVAWASPNVIPLRGGRDNHHAILTPFKCAANTVPLYAAPPATQQQAEPVQKTHDDSWEETARQYAENARYWREKYEATQQAEPAFDWRFSHHYTAENIAAIVQDLKSVENGNESPLWKNRDHRTRAGILWRVISALSHDVPTAVQQQAEPANDPVTLARLFHATYELLAPEYGYETRPDTKDFDPESKNGRLMVRVCAEISNAVFCPTPAVQQQAEPVIRRTDERFVSDFNSEYAAPPADDEAVRLLQWARASANTSKELRSAIDAYLAKAEK